MAILWKDEEVRQGKTTIEQITAYKNEVIEKIINNERLMKLVNYDRADWVRQKPIEDAEELVYDRIFPFRFVPEPTETQRTYITLSMNNFRRIEDGYAYSERYISCTLTFNIFTHVNLMRTNSGVRQDLIVAELDGMFNGEKSVGLGRGKLRGLNEIWFHNNKFGGYAFDIELVDLK